ncbi:hypothetical protein HDK90DRAFT_545460 [Phyllosticta capitalensis]|uniref:Uncharacterized protein n=1 Tax=Phyllosticta capitalensis TaxID=121624 RepID=A0ABR1YXK8_9PEZI
MASAPDIITYVGVPLTVLADAANGEVTVVVDSISCVHPGLWPDPDKKSGVQCTLTPGMLFKRWSHRVFFRYLHACEPMWTKLCSAWSNIILRWLPSVQETYRFSDIDADNFVGNLGEENKKMPAVWSWTGEGLSLVPKPFCLDEPDLLFRPWMAVAAKLGVCIHRELQYSHGLFLKRPALSFTVGMDMEIPKHPALAMDATDFLWFALALSVNPLTFDPTKAGFTYGKRCGCDKRPIMRFFDIEDDWCFELVRGGTKQQYSIRLALAWFNIVCSERDGSIFCRRLLEPTTEEAPLSKEFFDVYGFDPIKYKRSDHKAKRRALAAAIEWGYKVSWRNSHQSTEVAFPISQYMLETRERSLCYLFGLDWLTPKLVELFHEKAIFATLPAVSPSSNSFQETSAAEPTFLTIDCTGAEQETNKEDETLDQPNEHHDDFSSEACAEFLEKSVAQHREDVLQGKLPANSPHTVIKFQQNSFASSVLDCLRKQCTESQYLKKTVQAREFLRRLRNKVKECQDRSASKDDTRKAAIEVFMKLRRILSNPLLQSDEDSGFPGALSHTFCYLPFMENFFGVVEIDDVIDSLNTEDDSSNDSDDGSEEDVSEDGSEENGPEKHSSEKDGSKEDDSKDGSDEDASEDGSEEDGSEENGSEDEESDNSTMLLAHVLLGCLDWGNTQRTTWELDEAVSSDLQEIHKKLQNPNFDPDDLCQFLDEAAKRAGCGIYTASEEPVCELFKKFREKETVYLI